MTLSNIEIEYIAAVFCACQCVWLRKVLEKLGHKEEKSTLIQCDNNSTIQLSKNFDFHDKSNIRFHFLRDLTRDKVVELSYCNSQEQVADIMTKPFKLEQFLKLRSMLGMVNASVVN